MERIIELPQGELWTIFLEESNKLFLEEKKARHGNNQPDLCAVILKIIKYSYDSHEYDWMRKFVLMITKKRGQSKKAITEMVKLIFQYMELMETDQKFLTLITVRTISDGKLFLELEYARATKMYCDLLIAQGKSKEAANVIQEVQIETYGSMEKLEKIEYILYQMQLMLLVKDYTRLLIISKKLDSKYMPPNEYAAQRKKFYGMLHQLYEQEANYFECYKAIRGVYEATKAQIKGNPNEEMLTIFSSMVLYNLISENTMERKDTFLEIERTFEKEFAIANEISNLFQLFIKEEIIKLSEVEPIYSKYAIFKGENAIAHSDNMKKQILEHNLQIVQMYYSRISMKRLSELLFVNSDIIEQEIIEMVNSKMLKAKMDRLDGTIDFRRESTVNETMNNYSYSVKTLLEKIEETTHMITREYATYEKQ